MGTFSGALVSLVLLSVGRRRRASNLPPTRIKAVLVAFVLLWGFDGLNSVLALIPSLPNLYEPHNLLRFVTGFLEGSALAVLLLPMFNYVVMARPEDAGSVERMRWFSLPLLILGLLSVLMQSQVEPVLLATFILAVVGLLTLLTMANGMLALVLLKWEGQVHRRGYLVLPLALGLLASIGEISMMSAARTYLERFLPLLSI